MESSTKTRPTRQRPLRNGTLWIYINIILVTNQNLTITKRITYLIIYLNIIVIKTIK